MKNVPFQYDLRPELPNVFGALDYQAFRETLFKIDEILTKSSLEHDLVSEALEQYVVDHQMDPTTFYSSKRAVSIYKKLRHALRCNIARHLTGESYRLFSIRIADSTLFQWFTGISVFGCRKAISKSALDRYEKYFDEAFVAKKIREWLASLSNMDKALESGLHHFIDYSKIFMDSTCIKANIHFPADWVLLRDAARSLLFAIKSIRKQGLKHRMIEPARLLKQMNQFCIQMTHARRTSNSKKQRKRIFREMKKLTGCIAKHAKRYRKLLSESWEKTDWTKAQAQQVIDRIDNILNQLPQAIDQAHERIIGERKVLTNKKILSLYDKDAHVIVRGKAGNEVEFGQGLILTEQTDGLIIDWQLFANQPPSDSQLLKPVLERIEEYYGHTSSACADRGFASKKNDELLQEKKVLSKIILQANKKRRRTFFRYNYAASA